MYVYIHTTFICIYPPNEQLRWRRAPNDLRMKVYIYNTNIYVNRHRNTHIHVYTRYVCVHPVTIHFAAKRAVAP